LLCVGGGRQPAKTFLRSLLVVFAPPRFNDDLGAGQAGEPKLVQLFVAQVAVERFDTGVLIEVSGSQAAGASTQAEEGARWRAATVSSTDSRQRGLVDGLRFDRTAEGRVLKCLTVVDDATHEAVVIEVERAISGMGVARVMDRLALTRGLPKVIRSDNGKEFCGKALVSWAHERGVQLRLIEPRKPNQNAYI
jgi:transposase InsO family protein